MIKTSDLPDIIPVFPLPGALLLPRSRLPLHIFEPRYLAMIEDVLKTPHRLIGTRAAVLQRLVAFNAPQLVHRRYLEQEPRPGGGGVHERLVVVVEHVPRGELQQRQVVHEQHHSVRRLVALARGLSEPAERQVLVRPVRGAKTQQRD